MLIERRPPGQIRDAIFSAFATSGEPLHVSAIVHSARCRLGTVAASSVRSYLRLNTPGTFRKTGLGTYALRAPEADPSEQFITARFRQTRLNRATLVHADCFDWLATRQADSIHAVVTDPPYGLVEFNEVEKQKLRAGRGGVWRLPPSFDGHKRAPLPRFTTLSDADVGELRVFFERFGRAIIRVLVPGGNVVVASNPLLQHVVTNSLAAAGLEPRGSICRQVMTMRGGDRPKNAHEEFADVSVMPRSMWEPWIVLRKPLEGRVQDNLRKWKTGGFRRPSAERPFGDVIKSAPTNSERKIAAHPSLKPQAFMRELVRAALPLGEGIILDPFAGGGSTAAAANFIGYDSIGIEADAEFYEMAVAAVPKLERLSVGEVKPVRA